MSTIGGRILPELSLPTFSSREQSGVQFLEDRDEYLKLESFDERLKLTLCPNLLQKNLPKTGLWQPKNILTLMWSLKYYLVQIWNKESSHTQGHRFINVRNGSKASHLLKYAILGTTLQTPMSELEVIEAVTS